MNLPKSHKISSLTLNYQILTFLHHISQHCLQDGNKEEIYHVDKVNYMKSQMPTPFRQLCNFSGTGV